jgi:hypothetical protein
MKYIAIGLILTQIYHGHVEGIDEKVKALWSFLWTVNIFTSLFYYIHEPYLVGSLCSFFSIYLYNMLIYNIVSCGYAFDTMIDYKDICSPVLSIVITSTNVYM